MPLHVHRRNRANFKKINTNKSQHVIANKADRRPALSETNIAVVMVEQKKFTRKDIPFELAGHLKYSECIEPLIVAIPNNDTREIVKQAIKNHAAEVPFN